MSETNRYVSEVLLNGKPLSRSFLRHEEIVSGGELRFVMSASPNKNWATQESERPFSMSQEVR